MRTERTTSFAWNGRRDDEHAALQTAPARDDRDTDVRANVGCVEYSARVEAVIANCRHKRMRTGSPTRAVAGSRTCPSFGAERRQRYPLICCISVPTSK